MAHSLKFRAYNVARIASHTKHFFQIWELLGGENNHVLDKVWREYNDFWSVVRHGLFQAIINNCTMIDDRRLDGHNLSRIIEELIERKLDTRVPLLEMKNELATVAKPISKRVQLLRHNLFAHRSVNVSYREAMDKAAITHGDLRDLIEVYTRISDILLVRVFGIRSWLHDQPRKSAKKLLEDLARSVG